MRKLSLLTLIAAMACQLSSQAAPALAETLTVTPRHVADEKAVFATVESVSVVPARGRIGGT
ncbi:efflux RND transporter periplasmic adaptor subunit, partial [Bradyrhizobium oligotrophicum]